MITNKEVWFEQNKEKMVEVFKHAIAKAIVDMGDDIKCIDWFCSKAEQHIAERTKQ